MAYSLLIAGCGQLGTRYLQGLVPLQRELQIWIYDISQESLNLGVQRWKEAGGSSPGVKFLTDIAELPDELDLAIVATNADVRLQVVRLILDRVRVSNWVLEKVLAQNVASLDELVNVFGDESHCWVNTPMYMWPLYSLLKETCEKGPVSASFLEMEGLACNAIHYIDFISRWSDSEVESIDVTKLNSHWIASKRPGFFEVTGELFVNFTDGSSLRLSSKKQSNSFHVLLSTLNENWTVDETMGEACSDIGRKVIGEVPYQSQITTGLVQSIFDAGDCNLPRLEQSISQHKPLLESLLTHWNDNMPEKLKSLPIT